MSRYAVVGASSGTGRHIVDLLAQRGDEVRAISRTPLPSRDRVEPYSADVTNPASIAQALKDDFDAVFFTVDIHGKKLTKEAVRRAMLDGFKHTLRAAQAGGAKRVVLLSVIGPERFSWVWWLLNAMKPGMRDNVRDRELALKGGTLPYVICRAARLTDKPGGEAVTVRSAGLRLDMMRTLPRQDLAKVLVHAADRAPAGTIWDVYAGDDAANPGWNTP